MSFFKLSINLSAFKHVLMTKKGKNGQDVKGIFIPIEINKIKPSKDGKNIYANFIAFELKQPKDWGTHMIKQSFSKEERDKMTEEEQREQPIFGNATIETYVPQADNNDLGGGAVLNSDDDVPF